VLRFELEKALIDGSLRAEDVPDAWDAAMRELLGLSTGSNHRDGCMQDVHWPAGLFGYFPTYTLGALTAAQLYAAAVAAVPTIPSSLAKGDTKPLLSWLVANVHSQGARFSAPEIVQRATGKPLDPEVFRRHLETRYLD
jgi:carboxypeptidase Taq